MNRKLHIDSGHRFPPEMLDEVAKKSSKSARRGENASIYRVLVGENANGGPIPDGFGIETTDDLELANELALKHFREKWIDHLVNSRNGGAQPSALEWKLDNDAHIHLSAALPGTDNRLTVWVVAYVVSRRIDHAISDLPTHKSVLADATDDVDMSMAGS